MSYTITKHTRYITNFGPQVWEERAWGRDYQETTQHHAESVHCITAMIFLFTHQIKIFYSITSTPSQSIPCREPLAQKKLTSRSVSCDGNWGRESKKMEKGSSCTMYALCTSGMWVWQSSYSVQPLPLFYSYVVVMMNCWPDTLKRRDTATASYVPAPLQC